MEFVGNIIESIKLLFNYDVTVLISFFTVILVFLILSPIFSKIIIKIIQSITKENQKASKNLMYKTLNAFFYILGVFLSTFLLNFSTEVHLIIAKIFKIICILFVAKVLVKILTSRQKFKYLKTVKYGNGKIFAGFFEKIIACITYVIAGFLIIYELGYDLNGLVAGLGIGSAVIALAAQDVVKSLIGSFVIITEKPFEIGDFIEIDNFKGTVEDVTFRSVVIRTNDKSVVSIPSSKAAESYILNWARTGGVRRYEFDIGVTLETPLIKLNKFVETLKFEITTAISGREEDVSIHVEQLKGDCINLYCYTFVKAKNYEEFLDMKEKINYTVLNVVNKEKIELAYPTQTVYLKK